jgi:PAS domain S-box-containing protein
VLSRTRSHWAARYGGAALAVALTILLKVLLDPFLQEGSPFFLLSAGVLVAVAYGGFGPGVFATLLGALVGDYFFLSPVGTLVPPSAAHGLTTALFVVQGLAISAIGAWLSSSRRQAEESALRAGQDRESLGESEERYRAVIEQATEGIYLLDAETRRIVETNPALQRMLGYSGEELEGMMLYDLIDLPREEVDATLRRTLERGYRPTGERRYRRKDGGLVEVEIGASVIRDGGREIVCALLRNVTERKRAEAALREIREAERTRIGRDLHDGPLQDLAYGLAEVHIIGLDLADDHPATAALGRASVALRRGSEGLRDSVNDLRMGGELNSSLPALVEALVERDRLMDSECTISLEVQEGFPLGPAGDAGTEILRVVGEALTNVRRHSGARNVRVSLRAEGDDLVAEVSDDGRGFGPGTVPGVGQGSMRERAKALGGTLELESGPGEGTRVRLRVPRGVELQDTARDEYRPGQEGR